MMRFASHSISSLHAGRPVRGLRTTKYASSKSRLSCVRITIICFCAPLSILYLLCRAL